MKKEFKLGDKVMFEWEECTYIGEYQKYGHLIDWHSDWHDWRLGTTEAWAIANWYNFVWNKYRFANTQELYPVTKNIANL